MKATSLVIREAEKRLDNETGQKTDTIFLWFHYTVDRITGLECSLISGNAKNMFSYLQYVLGGEINDNPCIYYLSKVRHMYLEGNIF